MIDENKDSPRKLENQSEQKSLSKSNSCFNIFKHEYDSQLIKIINELNLVIKNYSKATKNKIFEFDWINQNITSQIVNAKCIIAELSSKKQNNNNNNYLKKLSEVLEALNTLKDNMQSKILASSDEFTHFFENSKFLFKQMKITINLKKEKLNQRMQSYNDNNLYLETLENEDKNFMNKGNIFLRHSMKETPPPKIGSESSSEIYTIKSTPKTVSRSNSAQKLKINQKLNKSRSITPNKVEIDQSYFSELCYVYALEVFKFLKEMNKLKESNLNRNLDIKERKLKVEKIKATLSEYTQNLLEHHYDKIIKYKNFPNEAIKRLNCDLAEKNEQMFALNMTIKDLQDKVSALENKNRCLSENLKDFSKLTKETLEQNKNFADVQQENVEIKKMLSQKELEINKLKKITDEKDIKKNICEIIALKEHNQNLNFNLQRMNDNYNSAKKDLKKIQNNLRDLSKQKLSDKQKMKSLQDEIKTKDLMLSQAKKDNQNLRASREKSANNYVKREYLLNQKKKENTKLIEQNNHNTCTIISLERKNTLLEEKNKVLSDLNDNLSKKVVQLTYEVQNKDNYISLLKLHGGEAIDKSCYKMNVNNNNSKNKLGDLNDIYFNNNKNDKNSITAQLTYSISKLDSKVESKANKNKRTMSNSNNEKKEKKHFVEYSELKAKLLEIEKLTKKCEDFQKQNKQLVESCKNNKKNELNFNLLKDENELLKMKIKSYEEHKQCGVPNKITSEEEGTSKNKEINLQIQVEKLTYTINEMKNHENKLKQDIYDLQSVNEELNKENFNLKELNLNYQNEIHSLKNQDSKHYNFNGQPFNHHISNNDIYDLEDVDAEQNIENDNNEYEGDNTIHILDEI